MGCEMEGYIICGDVESGVFFLKEGASVGESEALFGGWWTVWGYRGGSYVRSSLD